MAYSVRAMNSPISYRDAERLSGLTIGTTRNGRAWTGALRTNSKVAWTCGHAHPTRDNNSRLHLSAYSCATKELEQRLDRPIG